MKSFCMEETGKKCGATFNFRGVTVAVGATMLVSIVASEIRFSWRSKVVKFTQRSSVVFAMSAATQANSCRSGKQFLSFYLFS